MKGQRVGYIRVSTIDQNVDRQLEGIELDKKFIDKASSKDFKRVQFEAMMEYVRENDHVFVHSLDRLARNLDHLRLVVQTLNKKGVKISFIKENLHFDGGNSPMSVLIFSLMGAFAEFEFDLIKERQREGIAIAKAKGVYKKGRRKKLNEEQWKEITEMLKLGFTKNAVCKKFGISRQLLYNYIKSKGLKPIVPD